MLRSLHARLFAVATLVIVVALGVVAFVTQRFVRMEYRSLEVSDHAARGQSAADALAERLEREGDAAQIDSLLQDLGHSIGRGLVLVDPRGNLLGASSPELRDAGVRMARDGVMLIEDRVRRPGVVGRAQIRLKGPPGTEVRRADGSVVGRLVMLPPNPNGDTGAHRAFGGAFDLRLLLAALAAGAVALILTWILSRRILGPVAALTAASRRLGRGDLTSRVDVRSSDEIGELSRAFNSMADSLGRQETLRRTLVSDVAHELRTPLTNLRCQIEAVQDGLLAPSPETIGSLREEVLLLSRLVEDLQTLSVADAGRLALDRAPMAVRDVVDGAIEGFQARAAERGLTLASTVGELPPVNADATRIGQVLRNLLANAATHTPAGGRIEITAEVAAGSRDGAGAAAAAASGPAAPGKLVTISVSDNGPGIAAEHLPHVFERFYRADPSRARATGGAGLGLAIVKGIVQAHGGTVSAESEPGRGVTIRFTLPVAE